MSRRNIISSMIAEQLAAANSVPATASETPARVAAGPVRTMGLTLDKLELERKSLEEAVAAGGSVVELSTALVESSFAADRFADHGDAALEELKQSIAEHGQEVPILVRPIEGRAGYYQVAYGHRRLRACAALGLPVRAMVRTLSDAQLVIAQGLENANRVDLSFIEKALFALALEERGFDRTTIMAALSTDKTELSKLLAAVRNLPQAMVRAIGPAPKAGRRRWLQLAELLQGKAALQRCEKRIAEADFANLETDIRFTRVLDAALRSHADKSLRAPMRTSIKRPDGGVLVTVQETDRKTSLVIDRIQDQAFADYLIRALPDLYTTFLTEEDPDRSGGRQKKH
ncbi:MAG: plasmid partitioning protein RepB [Beijerinckiaceae bacterium]